MAEWSKAAVSKTVNGLARSGVQIPFSPPVSKCFGPCPCLSKEANFRCLFFRLLFFFKAVSDIDACDPGDRNHQ